MSAHVHYAGAAAQSLVSRGCKSFALFAWLTLAYNIPVILWGAYVRVSFSGDGCGANWPFCNGQLIPQKMSVPTAIEYTHRLMTSVDSVLVIVMCALAFLLFPKRHAVRRYSILSLVFLLIEALLGAGLVLFRYVAKDQSAGRAWYLSAHLTNTMLLLAALVTTAWLAGSGIETLRLRSLSPSLWAALGVTVFVSVTGTVTALGDTLFPASSLHAGMQQDLARTSSLLLRLRMVHPLIALVGAGYLLSLAARIWKAAGGGTVARSAVWVAAVVLVQLAAGMVNVSLLAPLWMQLTHLFIADVLFVAVVILALETRLHE